VKRQPVHPKLRADAPLVECADCDLGGQTCPECGGAGELCAGHPNNPHADYFPCAVCHGKGERDCPTCEGRGAYPNPEAVCECRCGGLIDDETDACVECGKPWLRSVA
jgi:hypothetical protein